MLHGQLCNFFGVLTAALYIWNIVAVPCQGLYPLWLDLPLEKKAGKNNMNQAILPVDVAWDSCIPCSLGCGGEVMTMDGLPRLSPNWEALRIQILGVIGSGEKSWSPDWSPQQNQAGNSTIHITHIVPLEEGQHFHQHKNIPLPNTNPAN